MIRLAPSVKSSRSSASSSSSAYDSSSSIEPELPLPVVKPAPLPPTPSTPVQPNAEGDLPIWEDYMPDLQQHIEDLTRALGAYIKESSAQPQAGRTSSSSESEAETVAPPAASSSSVHQVASGSKKKKSKSSSSPAAAPPTEVGVSEKSNKIGPQEKKKNAATGALPKNKKQLVQLAKKLTLALEKNF